MRASAQAKNVNKNPHMENRNITPIAQLVLQGLNEVLIENDKNKIKRKQSKPETARFKLKFWYLDGNCSTHYSYDYDYIYPDGIKTKVHNEKRGLYKLLTLIGKNKEADTFISAIVWINLSSDLSTETGRYDFCIAKSTRGSSGRTHPNLKFESGKVITQYLEKPLR